MRPTLVIYHMTGCGACEALVGKRGSAAGLRRVDVLEVARGQPFEKESWDVWGVPKSDWYPSVLLACPGGTYVYSAGPRDTKTLQRWIDAKLREAS